MHELALEQRRELGVRAPWHVGDITWGLRQHEGREDEWTIRVWKDGDRTVAWSWLKSAKGWLEFDVRARAARPAGRDPRRARAPRSPSASRTTRKVRAALRRARLQSAPSGRSTCNARDLAEPPEQAPLPDGFRCRTVEPDDLAERVAIHRDVWAPSRVTESSYANVMAAWPYRASLDCVVEAPDGRFAAYVPCLAGRREPRRPVRACRHREEFRRRGLGAAVCTFALRRLHEEGIRQAVVGCVTDPACALYESIGFRRHATLVGYSR